MEAYDLCRDRCNQEKNLHEEILIGVCPAVPQKLVLCVPFLYRWWGSCGQQIKANVQGPMKQNARSGARSEAPRRRWRPGQEQHSGQENQDSQHMLNQPRGSSADLRRLSQECLGLVGAKGTQAALRSIKGWWRMELRSFLAGEEIFRRSPHLTIRTSWITPHHFIFQELISVIISLPITPNNFWGFKKRNSQKLTPPCLVPIRKYCTIFYTKRFSTSIGKPQMWERADVGFGGTGRKRKGPYMKQCAWREHGLCDTLLAEACPPKL